MNEARRFQLVRDRDVTGVSGVGIVADGVLWPDDTVSIRWKGDRPSIVHWGRLADAEAVHGHGGATRFVWLDAADTPQGDRKYTQRGFRTYAEVIDRYGSHVSVQESSLATEDCVWIHSRNDHNESPSPHLTVDNARTIRDALSEFIRDVDALDAEEAANEPGEAP